MTDYKYNPEIHKLVELHSKWLQGKPDGVRADFTGQNLEGMYFCGMDLTKAIFHKTKINDCDFADAILEEVKFEDCTITETTFKHAKLNKAVMNNCYIFESSFSSVIWQDAFFSSSLIRDTNFNSAVLSRMSGTDMSFIGSDLSWVQIDGADITEMNFNNSVLEKAITSSDTKGYFSVCPEEGSFIGYKKAADNAIVKLKIPKSAKRSSATTRKCRASKAKVLSITTERGEEVTFVRSNFDPHFSYVVGKIIEVKNFDENRWNECSTGIHFFMTREEAKIY